jgi:Ca2+-binding EF-hand superfamily protein
VVGPPNTVVGPPAFGGAPVFDSLDADRNGLISSREANANRATSLGFARADTDGDGSISVEEFRTAFTSSTSR